MILILFVFENDPLAVVTKLPMSLQIERQNDLIEITVPKVLTVLNGLSLHHTLTD